MFLSDIQVAERYNLKARETVWSWIKTQSFPKPIKLSPGCTRWKLSDIEEWEAKRPAV